jgi:hypothetical protein
MVDNGGRNGVYVLGVEGIRQVLVFLFYTKKSTISWKWEGGGGVDFIRHFLLVCRIIFTSSDFIHSRESEVIFKSYFKHFKNLHRFEKGDVQTPPSLYVQHPGMSIGFLIPGSSGPETGKPGVDS